MALSTGVKIGYGLVGVTGLGLVAYALTRKSAAAGPAPAAGAAPTFDSANGTITTSATCPNGKMPIPLADGRTYCPKGQPAGTFVPKPRDCESGKAVAVPEKHGYNCI
jgi:hypothetical protein